MLTSAACIVIATMERIFHAGREEVLVKFRNQSQHLGNARGLQKCACSDTAATETNIAVSPIVDPHLRRSLTFLGHPLSLPAEPHPSLPFLPLATETSIAPQSVGNPREEATTPASTASPLRLREPNRLLIIQPSRKRRQHL